MQNWRLCFKATKYYSRELLVNVLRVLRPNALALGSAAGSLQAIQLVMIISAGYPLDHTIVLIQRHLGWSQEAVSEMMEELFPSGHGLLLTK